MKSDDGEDMDADSMVNKLMGTSVVVAPEIDRAQKVLRTISFFFFPSLLLTLLFLAGFG